MAINKKRLIIILVAITFLIFLILIRIFYSEKTIIIKDAVVGEVSHRNENLYYATVSNNNLKVYKRDLSTGDESVIYSDTLAGESINIHLSENESVFAVTYYGDLEEKRKTIFINELGAKRELASAPSSIFFKGDLAIALEEETDFGEGDGYFYSYNLSTKFVTKITGFLPSGSPQFVKNDLNKILFFMNSPHNGGVVNKIYELDLENKKVVTYLEDENLVGIKVIDGSLALATFLENNKYNVYEYNLYTKERKIISENNLGIRVSYFEGKYYGVESTNKEGSVYDYQFSDSIDEFGVIYPKNKTLTKHNGFKKCHDPLVLSKKEAYLVCEETLYLIKNYNY